MQEIKNEGLPNVTMENILPNVTMENTLPNVTMENKTFVESLVMTFHDHYHNFGNYGNN